MNIRSRRRRERETIPVSKANSVPSAKILSEEEFQFEITKEISRSNRRQFAREFAVLRFPAVLKRNSNEQVRNVLDRVRQRLRISDVIGWQNGHLAILLPETGFEGAVTLANALSISLSDSRPLDSEVAVYPWDDELISMAEELSFASPTDELEDTSASFRFNDSKSLTPDESVHVKFNQPANPSHGPVATIEQRAVGSEISAQTAVESTTQIRFLRRGSDVMTRIMVVRPTPVWKRGVDIVVASIGLAILSPFFIGTAVAIKANSRGPVFFRQRREGKDGRVFGILKFRTMVVEAELLQAELRLQNEQDGPAFKLSDDPRVTSVGRYLRKSCFDELPQLWNVLKGDMSLVGPRPLPVGESHGCKAWHRARLTVLPGLTCTWQAIGRRNEIKFDDWMRMDLEYIQKQSFWFDLKLLVQTAVLAILHRGSV